MKFHGFGSSNKNPSQQCQAPLRFLSQKALFCVYSAGNDTSRRRVVRPLVQRDASAGFGNDRSRFAIEIYNFRNILTSRFLISTQDCRFSSWNDKCRWQMLSAAATAKAIYPVAHGPWFQPAGRSGRVWVVFPLIAASFHSKCFKDSSLCFCTQFAQYCRNDDPSQAALSDPSNSIIMQLHCAIFW